ncbi:holin [Bacillus phage vB_BcgM]|nr:holin [Bacillus phage vB_BcgM]
MFSLFKILRCKHKWFEVEPYSEWQGTRIGYQQRVRIFCPKCESNRDVSAADWGRHLRREFIKEEYERTFNRE